MIKIERESAPAEGGGSEDAEMTSTDAMQTFIDAVKAGDAASAHSAFQSYMTMCETEKPMMAEPSYEKFSG